MKKELEDLYVQWGFPPENLPSAAADPAEITFGAEQPAENADFPVLDENGPQKVAEAYQKDPQRVFELYQRITEKPGLTRQEFEKNLDDAQRIAAQPASAPETEVSFVPPDLTEFRKYLIYPDVKVDNEVEERKYEEGGDWYRWLFWAGGPFILLDVLNIPLKKYPFPYHDASSYSYDVVDMNGQTITNRPVRIALFADFGTGSYHSKYIAHQINALSPDYAIHLGDVYYAGRSHEVRDHLKKPMSPLLSKMRFFTMNANHEMLSRGEPYFEYIKEKRKTKHDQQGSYFCLRSGKYQLIGLDTAYHKDGRHEDERLQDWFTARMKEGTQKGLVTILLTPNEPYELGKPGTTELYNDIKKSLGGGEIFLWFWGNTHYCTFFGRSDETPFYASCIGHAGYPILRKKVLKKEQANQQITGAFRPPAEWIDKSYRFNERIREDLGNSGFVLLTLENTGVKLDYFDWLKRENKPIFSKSLNI